MSQTYLIWLCTQLLTNPEKGCTSFIIIFDRLAALFCFSLNGQVEKSQKISWTHGWHVSKNLRATEERHCMRANARLWVLNFHCECEQFASTFIPLQIYLFIYLFKKKWRTSLVFISDYNFFNWLDTITIFGAHNDLRILSSSKRALVS